MFLEKAQDILNVQLRRPGVVSIRYIPAGKVENIFLFKNHHPPLAGRRFPFKWFVRGYRKRLQFRIAERAVLDPADDDDRFSRFSRRIIKGFLFVFYATLRKNQGLSAQRWVLVAQCDKIAAPGHGEIIGNTHTNAIFLCDIKSDLEQFEKLIR